MAKSTGLKKKYIKLAGKKGFKEAWRLQKLAERKAKAARKKPAKKKTVKKKTVRKAAKKKTVRKKAVRKKAPSRKMTVKKVVKRKTIKRKGPTMAKKKNAPKRHKRRNGGGKMNIQKTLTDGMFAAAGAVGASALANMVPLPDPRMKAAIPILAAILLPTTKIVKGDMARALSMGMLTIGAVSMLRQFMPALPLLAGEDTDYLDYVPDGQEELAMLGTDLDEELMLGGESIDIAGESIDIAGDEEFFTLDD